ncbi:hypothetical protein GCM10009716_39610 [Streptomyces sodiiphilus]|uniref:Transposase IS116/IS110/IS902 C-terminal domain-containing protein n=1 Tax=Streptomyces sodiiphilus TaxID=226217 RepID=A0ABN2PP53_9ACTN
MTDTSGIGVFCGLDIGKVRTPARILIDIGDGSVFPTAGHLTSYAGLAPATRTSGFSIRGDTPPDGATSSSNAPSTSPRSPHPGHPRAYYDKKRTEGKHRVAALTCLARRRTDVLFAMLRNGTLFQPSQRQQLDEARRGTFSAACAHYGKEGVGEHGEGAVPVPGHVAADLVPVQATFVLRCLEALLDRPPETCTRSRSSTPASRGAWAR